MAHDLNRIQYVILNIPPPPPPPPPLHSMSCNEICEIENHCKVPTIYKHIRILEDYGYVTRGAKIERASGFILTEQGMNVFPKSTESMEG